MASGVTRVIERCDAAIETEVLDLSECQLIQIPDAVFHLMRNTTVKICNISFNVITKIPPKLGSKFSTLTELIIANNKISKLPEELSELQELVKLDISFNTFVSVPRVIYSLQKLKEINAEKNYIIDVDSVNLAEINKSLTLVNLKQNPLSPASHESLSSITSITILLTPREIEDWEKWSEELK
ncbi:unnamed protein product [Allacma fusca]|uniref:Leucine-rich repeat-containing protein 20 n=1 Tax=Allacma fusca TaxID=39272 RepID=A0A8J2K7V3_9HEXA|nr:unnamed protein product [Allacma fusca]